MKHLLFGHLFLLITVAQQTFLFSKLASACQGILYKIKILIMISRQYGFATNVRCIVKGSFCLVNVELSSNM